MTCLRVLLRGLNLFYELSLEYGDDAYYLLSAAMLSYPSIEGLCLST